MQNQNIHFKSEEISNYFKVYRSRWEDFYPSEKFIISKTLNKQKKIGNLLDLGCASGGLGLAIFEKFPELSFSSYTGIDINPQNIELAYSRNWPKNLKTQFYCQDFLLEKKLKRDFSDIVVSLSCIDWNVEFLLMLNKAFEFVTPGGFLILSMRLTEKNWTPDFAKSYQWINYSGKELNPEKTHYVIFNVKDSIMSLMKLNPQSLDMFGYYGPPTKLSVTPFNELIFVVVAIEKKSLDVKKAPSITLDIPLSKNTNLEMINFIEENGYVRH